MSETWWSSFLVASMKSRMKKDLLKNRRKVGWQKGVHLVVAPVAGEVRGADGQHAGTKICSNESCSSLEWVSQLLWPVLIVTWEQPLCYNKYTRWPLEVKDFRILKQSVSKHFWYSNSCLVTQFFIWKFSQFVKLEKYDSWVILKLYSEKLSLKLVCWNAT